MLCWLPMTRRCVTPADTSASTIGAISAASSCLLEIAQGTRPILGDRPVVGQALHVFGDAVGVHVFDRLGDEAVQRPPALVEERGVGDLVGARA